MARPLGGGVVCFASAVPARHLRCLSNAGLRLISAAGTPRPELAPCPRGASLRSLVVDGGWGRAGVTPLRRMRDDQRRSRAPNSGSDQAPTKARSSEACALSLPIAKRERNARRSRAHSNPITAAAAQSPRLPARHATLASNPVRPLQLVASSGRGVPAGEIKRRPAFATQHESRAGTPDVKPSRPPLEGRAIRRKVRRAPNDLRRGQHGETKELRQSCVRKPSR